jgi:cytoskeletal protein CcmA (bactofilin family)
MTFALIRSPAFTDGTRFYDHELDEIQGDLVLALDTRGGAYTMAAPIVFSGSTWSLPGTTFTGDVVLSEDVTIGTASSDVLDVAATATFHPRATFSGGIDVTVSAVVTGDVSVSGTLTCTGDTVLGNEAGDALTVAATSSFTGAATFHGAVTFVNPITLQGTTTCDGTITSTSGLTFNSAETHTGAVTLSGALIANSTATFTGGVTATAGCSIPERGLYLAADADATIYWSTCNYLHIPHGVLGANRAFTLSTVDIPEGAVFRARSQDDDYAAIIGGMSLQSGAATYHYLEFVFISGSWRLRRGDIGVLA